MKRKEPKTAPDCALCDIAIFQRSCIVKKGRGSRGCPTGTRREVLEEANREYEDPSVGEFAHQASVQEGEGYGNRDQQPYIMQPTNSRMVEICEFSEKMHYKRLGIAFCIGLVKEAKAVADILRQRGFDVVSVVCKAGRSSKEKIGISQDEKVFRNMDEPMCNPIYQAKILNHEKVEFNILVGLCVGHDSLFFKYAEAPTTVLAVKDRVTGHNPLAAIYLCDSYYQKLKYKGL